MRDGKQRKQRLARRISLSYCKHCNSKTSSSNSSSDGAPAVIHQTEFAEKATVEPPATADFLMILSALLMILVQPHRLPSSLVKGLHRCRICCSWTSPLCQSVWRLQMS